MEALEKTINEHSVAVVINSPNNPSGVVYTEETLKKIAELLERKSKEYGHPIYIVADEPYRELVYDSSLTYMITQSYATHGQSLYHYQERESDTYTYLRSVKMLRLYMTQYLVLLVRSVQFALQH